MMFELTTSVNIISTVREYKDVLRHVYQRVKAILIIVMETLTKMLEHLRTLT
jgi:hypothetical protein